MSLALRDSIFYRFEALFQIWSEVWTAHRIPMDSPTTPKVRLSRIRDHGWSLWDPIGLLGEGGHFSGKWSDAKNAKFADEYDRYLIDAAHQVRRGVPAQLVVEFLVDIEANQMGLGERESTRERAQALVAAIRQDDLIWTWPDENGHFK